MSQSSTPLTTQVYKFVSSQFEDDNIVLNNDNIKDITKSLYGKGVLTKDYEEDGMILLYNNYNNESKSVIESECRSIIVNRSNFNIISYSCPTPLYNRDAMSYLMRNQLLKNDMDMYECYEGSLLTVFFHNDKWYFSSRRNISSSDDNPHFNMFLDVLKNDGYENFDDFCKILDVKYNYYFVLIHHKNMNVVNYEKQFGENYKKLCFIFARNGETQEEVNAEDLNLTILSENIFLPKKVDNIEYFDKMNQEMEITERPYSEGIIVKVNNKLLKLQNMVYQFYKAIGPEKNLFRGFIHLYQINKLKDYFELNTNTQKFKKLVNPLKTSETYDTIGTIDALVNVCVSELFHLFGKLYNMEDGSNKNKELYDILPTEYKTMLFNIRRIFFVNQKRNIPFTEKNIYFYLKNLDTNIFERFLRVRKLMLNWSRINKTYAMKLFIDSLYKCAKIRYILSSIYTAKLFPEIMQSDLPDGVSVGV